MKKSLLVFGLMGLLCACADDEPEIDCSLFDPAFPTLFIKWVDESGNNLITNGSIQPDSLRVAGNFPNAGFFFNPGSNFGGAADDIRQLDNTMELILPDRPEFRYTLFLSQNDSLVLDFTAEFTKLPCNLSYYRPTGVRLQGTELDLIVVPTLQFLVALELER